MGEGTTEKRGRRKERQGTVIGISGRKTIVVRVERRTKHPLYGKIMREHKKFHAHDEKELAKPGDKVRIVETRPLSKMKRWMLAEIIG